MDGPRLRWLFQAAKKPNYGRIYRTKWTPFCTVCNCKSHISTGHNMVQRISKWLLRRLFANSKVRAFFKQELSKTEPLLSNQQLNVAPPGHYDCPLPDISVLDRTLHDLYTAPNGADGISLNPDGQLRL